MGSTDTVVKKRPSKSKSGSSAKGRQAGHHKATGKYIRQRARTAKNKEKRWKRHLANHPKDIQAIRYMEVKKSCQV